MNELIKQVLKQAYGNTCKVNPIGNMFLTKREVSAHETNKRILSFPVGHSNIDFLRVKKNRIRMLKSPLILEKMHLGSVNIFPSNIIDKYKK